MPSRDRQIRGCTVTGVQAQLWFLPRVGLGASSSGSPSSSPELTSLRALKCETQREVSLPARKTQLRWDRHLPLTLTVLTFQIYLVPSCLTSAFPYVALTPTSARLQPLL